MTEQRPDRKVRVKHFDGFHYVFEVSVTDPGTGRTFNGVVQRVFNDSSHINDGGTEVCPGNAIYRAWVGKEAEFDCADVL